MRTTSIILDRFQKLGNRNIKSQGTTNMDEKGFVMGYSKQTKVVTRRGQKNYHVKQDGTQGFITAIEAVTADGYMFPSFLMRKVRSTISDGIEMFAPKTTKTFLLYRKMGGPMMG